MDTLIEIIVENLEEKTRIDKYLAQQDCLISQDISRAYCVKLMNSGHILHNDHVAKPSIIVRNGDVIKVNIPPPSLPIPKAVSMALDIIYEDSDIIVIHKPIGLTVHPGAGHTNDTLVNGLLFHCKDSLSGIGGVMRPGIVHRLDKDTSGVMVIAKNDKAHHHLSAQFKEHTIQRRYQAMCYGTPPQKEGTIESFIGRHPFHRQKMTVLKKGGKWAVTHYHCLKQLVFKDYPYLSLIDFTLETGRTHQIRVHASQNGFSLVGDPVYGSMPTYMKYLPETLLQQVKSYTVQALHAYYLGFIHPTTQEFIEFEASFPDSFQKLKQVFDPSTVFL